jgi:WD40 repeat protein
MRRKKLKIAVVAVLVAVLVVVVLWERQAKGPETAKVLDLGSGQRGRRVVWSPDGEILAVVTKYESMIFGHKGSSVRLWDVEKGQVRETVAESKEKWLAFQQVVFSPDGKTIGSTVSESIAGASRPMIREQVKLWDTKSLDLKQTLGGIGSLGGLALSPDGKLVAAGDLSKKTVALWSAATGMPERTLQTKTQPWSMVFSPDSKTLVIGGQNDDHSGQVQFWDAQTWTLKHVSNQDSGINEVAFSPDGKMVASCGGGELIQVWNVETGELILSLKGDKHWHRTVAFSPDSKIVAAGGADRNVRLWDVQTGQLIETLKGHTDQIYSISFSPDGKTLASTSQDETVRLWPIQNQPAERK